MLLSSDNKHKRVQCPFPLVTVIAASGYFIQPGAVSGSRIQPVLSATVGVTAENGNSVLLPSSLNPLRTQDPLTLPRDSLPCVS